MNFTYDWFQKEIGNTQLIISTSIEDLYFVKSHVIEDCNDI